MAQSATPATQNPTSRHNGGTASQLRKHVRVTDEEDFRVTDEGLSMWMSHWVRNLVVNAVRRSRRGKMPASTGSNRRAQVKRASSSPALTFLKFELARALYRA